MIYINDLNHSDLNRPWLLCLLQDCCSLNLDMQWQPPEQRHHQLRHNNMKYVHRPQQHLHLASGHACCSATTALNLPCKVSIW